MGGQGVLLVRPPSPPVLSDWPSHLTATLCPISARAQACRASFSYVRAALATFWRRLSAPNPRPVLALPPPCHHICAAHLQHAPRAHSRTQPYRFVAACGGHSGDSRDRPRRHPDLAPAALDARAWPPCVVWHRRRASASIRSSSCMRDREVTLACQHIAEPANELVHVAKPHTVMDTHTAEYACGVGLARDVRLSA